MRNSTHCKQKTVLLRAIHIWNVRLAKNKANEISCLYYRDVLRKIFMMRCISGTVTDLAACNFLKKSSTVVISKDLSKSFEKKINKKIVSVFRTFQRKCLYKEIHSCKSYWVLPPAFWKYIFQKLSNKANEKAVSALRTFLEKCVW